MVHEIQLENILTKGMQVKVNYDAQYLSTVVNYTFYGVIDQIKMYYDSKYETQQIVYGLTDVVSVIKMSNGITTTEKNLNDLIWVDSNSIICY